MGAGGTSGGVGRFFIGLAMMVAGGYLFFDAISVHTGFGWGRPLLRVGGYGLTGGMVLIPFLFGIGLIFYNADKILGWLLAAASLIMLGVGVIASIEFRLKSMSSFELLTILALLFGGLGLFLSSLKARDPGRLT
ncbi:hypothetical protein [Megalodesulfovibrio gigas]|uniref:Uncharacterized protein n=1 Tax=Megalodesulfovibrio gigas (strain ATCC 19364 / DSM 1382 / NCIMB 9332 / VKM B-1759) TaxID=1121448 RepID=T2G8F2_MEGG1|nr:hypothetical protein [Megalodesulfovibrio gigas]AGW12464.1 hypothetical protein DGI_0556 [Megalodesulfovibrio gigas DSM 1382 = ATCC 19364]